MIKFLNEIHHHIVSSDKRLLKFGVAMFRTSEEAKSEDYESSKYDDNLSK